MGGVSGVGVLMGDQPTQFPTEAETEENLPNVDTAPWKGLPCWAQSESNMLGVGPVGACKGKGPFIQWQWPNTLGPLSHEKMKAHSRRHRWVFNKSSGNVETQDKTWR